MMCTAFWLLSGRSSSQRFTEMAKVNFGRPTEKHAQISSRTTETPTETHHKLEIEKTFEPSDLVKNRTVHPFETFEAMIVFTLIRHDLLDLHLASIDYPTNHVFVILNYKNDNIKNKMLSVLEKYEDCHETTNELFRDRRCRNPNIKTLLVLSHSNNIGFAGSCNVGIKAMIEHDLSYAVFSGDDTRFLPQRIRAAKVIIDSSPHVCMFHLEAYSSFVITRMGAQRIGPFDENFWPAYAEDCDYWFRALLVGCPLFYRGGYSPETYSIQSMRNAFVEHGDAKDSRITGSVTHKSNPRLSRLVEGTLHPTRGRFAYLIRKWGFNTCEYYHEVINKWRGDDEVVVAPDHGELTAHNARVYFPYNDSVTFSDIRRWYGDDWRKPGAISSRAVNYADAPDEMVWKEADYVQLGKPVSFTPREQFILDSA